MSDLIVVVNINCVNSDNIQYAALQGSEPPHEVYGRAFNFLKEHDHEGSAISARIEWRDMSIEMGGYDPIRIYEELERLSKEESWTREHNED